MHLVLFWRLLSLLWNAFTKRKLCIATLNLKTFSSLMTVIPNWLILDLLRKMTANSSPRLWQELKSISLQK